MDKTGVYSGCMQNLLGDSFLFSKGDEKWKAKRKGLGHAFYKDKLVVLLDTLKARLLKRGEQLEAEI